MAACRPADCCDVGGVHEDAEVREGLWHFGARPLVPVPDVGHGALDEVDFGTEAEVETDRQKPVGEEVARLSRSDVFSREGHVAATMYHESWNRVSGLMHPRRRILPTYRERLGSSMWDMDICENTETIGMLVLHCLDVKVELSRVEAVDGIQTSRLST
jgi:hypothetical protein